MYVHVFPAARQVTSLSYTLKLGKKDQSSTVHPIIGFFVPLMHVDNIITFCRRLTLAYEVRNIEVGMKSNPLPTLGCNTVFRVSILDGDGNPQIDILHTDDRTYYIFISVNDTSKRS